MPTKRKRTRAPGQERPAAEMDLPPSAPLGGVSLAEKRGSKRKKGRSQPEKEGGPTKQELADYPRAFRTLLRQEELVKRKKEREQEVQREQQKKAPKARKNGENAGSEAKAGKNNTNTMKMQVGESYNEYSRRLKTQTRQILNDMNGESQAKVDRKKRWRAKMKEKEERKKLKAREDQEALDFDDLQDRVQFGEVVQQPPTLTVAPKARGKAAQQLAANKAKAAGKAASADTTSTPAAARPKTLGDVAADDLRAQNRRRLKDMSAATRRILDTERDRVVNAYRTAKEAKLKARLQQEQS
ncbi:hypothetical protein THASP1DRAFT_27466 [Thamnocephalis sphaerospora]|uniref:Coiled-coil domain-containing protein 137 n=1 Tax=Thamnocephalis sphaerospora TaxID=78915 RepID=A0A4P9XWQ0_9FUNG|nr:hypothetical protein THASP1DRAFT_27466 [Thamnocephalis sphaerospora]|eukprot:RKP10758.1 hypothetical protein THASP1DRAFT_27466 [Thamnocephalis sphaerospora]